MTVIAGACVWSPAHEIDMACYLLRFSSRGQQPADNCVAAKVFAHPELMGSTRATSADCIPLLLPTL
jgi:hypothetical protein